MTVARCGWSQWQILPSLPLPSPNCLLSVANRFAVIPCDTWIFEAVAFGPCMSMMFSHPFGPLPNLNRVHQRDPESAEAPAEDRSKACPVRTVRTVRMILVQWCPMAIIPTISKAYIRHMCGIYYQGLCKGISPRNMAFNFIWYSISIFGSWSSHWPLVHIVHDSSAWSVECRIRRAEIDNTELHAFSDLNKECLDVCLESNVLSLISSTIHFAGF